MNTRLYEALAETARIAELIPLSSIAVASSMNDRVCDQPTDNLILHVIMLHAASDPDARKALFTQNLPDFTRNGGRERLRDAGIHVQLGSHEALNGWLTSVKGSE